MIGQLFINGNGHLQVDNMELINGQALQVLVCDGLTGATEWIDTTVQDNGSGNYCLEGLLGYSIIGLFAKLPNVWL